MEWWRELFELSTESLTMKEFVRCVRTRLLHIVNRKYDYDPLEYVGATGLTQSVRGFLLPVLKDLPPPVSLFWIVSAARPIGRGRKDKTPFSNDGVAGQSWSTLKREACVDPRYKNHSMAYLLSNSQERIPPH